MKLNQNWERHYHEENTVISVGYYDDFETPAVGSAADKIEMTCGEELTYLNRQGYTKQIKRTLNCFCDDNRMIMTMEEDVYDWWFIGH